MDGVIASLADRVKELAQGDISQAQQAFDMALAAWKLIGAIAQRDDLVFAAHNGSIVGLIKRVDADGNPAGQGGQDDQDDQNNHDDHDDHDREPEELD